VKAAGSIADHQDVGLARTPGGPELLQLRFIGNPTAIGLRRRSPRVLSGEEPMCGIYGILSSPEPVRRLACEPFFDGIEELLRSVPERSGPVADETLARLEELRSFGYRFVDRDGLVAVLSSDDLAAGLADAAKRILDWLRSLEALVEGKQLEDLENAERVNRLIVGARDLAWQIDKDVLGNVARVRELAAGGDESDGKDRWCHLWALNLVLNNIDRLEVRGRDSAGLAVYAHFRDASRLEAFLARLQEAGFADQLAERGAAGSGSDRALFRPQADSACLLFTYKVANEVGEMGDNVRSLRAAIAGDAVFQRVLREKGVRIQALAHTRWASNGIISIANCHPVDSSIYQLDEAVAGSRGAIVSVLNGDIDNYQELFREFIIDKGLRIDAGVTTDAKIIPVVIGHHYRETGDLEAAFRKAFDAFEGSMAIGIMAADRPGEFLFGQKGSGQGLFFGFAGNSTAMASEMYGLVELTQSYAKADGERVRGGEIFKISAREGGGASVEILGAAGASPLPRERVRQAEITTRDINRGSYPRFFLKEISESVQTVRKTLRGKYELAAGGKVRFILGPSVLHPERMEELRRGKVRRIIAIGQGTAAVAAQGIALLLEKALAGSRLPIQIQSMKATELSGHHLRRDMGDCLVIAVSQSGTTTDTNRTVDLARERGAWVIGIVNRRNSDLVYKSHGVLYTSDGRDIEMSVASTKAFYAQNVAGQVLALALAHALEAISDADLRSELEALDRLPAAMEKTLALGDQVAQLATSLASRRRHWAIVGSGLEKISADEIRIKLSELCYKSIACDFTEDKKHIDLSSEPLVIVCAVSTPRSTISDVVKEVSIFKAHQSIPVVITHEGESRFDPYAKGVIKVPAYRGTLSYLLATMVGHLFGYHAAASFDRHAGQLRAIRTGILQALEAAGPSGALAQGELQPSDLALGDDTLSRMRDFLGLLSSGTLDGCLAAAVGLRLGFLFQTVLGRIPAASHGLFGSQEGGGFLGALMQSLTKAINELSRPIDAIKHQAKTVTVGISRAEEELADGPLMKALSGLEIDLQNLLEAHRKFIAAFEPFVESVAGCTLYRIDGLDAVGRPREESTIEAVQKTGCASRMYSRCDSKVVLSGTKWGVVRSREIYLGCGQTDGNKILIVPVIGERPTGHLALFHVELNANRDRTQRQRALSAHRSLLERLQIAVTERNQEWQPQLLDRIDNDTLFFESPERVAEEIVARIGAA
jgi:glucosamine--fructose-6-phosphate aminotransferase (isomerizing)